MPPYTYYYILSDLELCELNIRPTLIDASGRFKDPIRQSAFALLGEHLIEVVDGVPSIEECAAKLGMRVGNPMEM